MTGLAQDTTVPVFDCILRHLSFWYYMVSFKPVLTVTPLTEWSLQFVASRPSSKTWITVVFYISVSAACKAQFRPAFWRLSLANARGANLLNSFW
jgi:hypothetical protein